MTSSSRRRRSLASTKLISNPSARASSGIPVPRESLRTMLSCSPFPRRPRSRRERLPLASSAALSAAARVKPRRTRRVQRSSFSTRHVFSLALPRRSGRTVRCFASVSRSGDLPAPERLRLGPHLRPSSVRQNPLCSATNRRAASTSSLRTRSRSRNATRSRKARTIF